MINKTGFPRLDNAVNHDDTIDAVRYVVDDVIKQSKVDKHKQLTTHLSDTYRRKNKDYGDAFGKTHKKYGAVSGLTRMSDKFYRIEELILSGEQLVDDESVLDTLLDLANYSLMLYMELNTDGKD